MASAQDACPTQALSRGNLRRDSKKIRTDKYDRLDIVDGQQRVTTLILLLKAMEQALDESDPDESLLRNEIAGLLVKDDSGTLLLLQTNHDRSTYFADYIRDGVVPNVAKAGSLADKDLAKAIVECREFVEKWSVGNRSLLELATIIKNRLTFIFHEINDEAAVYTAFEVLNSRGLEVAWLDRTKSLLMAIAFEHAKGKIMGKNMGSFGAEATRWRTITRRQVSALSAVASVTPATPESCPVADVAMRPAQNRGAWCSR